MITAGLIVVGAFVAGIALAFILFAAKDTETWGLDAASNVEENA